MIHYDILTREIKVDDYVMSDGAIFKISKMNPKMLTGEKIYGLSKRKVFYGNECAKVPEEDVLMFLLTKK